MKPHEAAASRSEVLNDMDGTDQGLAGSAQLRVENIEKHEVEDMGSKGSITLTPPDAMFKPIDYPPLHIFVSFSNRLLFAVHWYAQASNL